LRYTRAGGVVIGARRCEGAVRIDVIDTGVESPPPIEPASSTNSCRSKRRRAMPRTRLGLGLAIVRRLCTLLEHPLDVASTPGSGSRFR
jgi:signal transduction histidine kinase